MRIYFSLGEKFLLKGLFAFFLPPLESSSSSDRSFQRRTRLESSLDFRPKTQKSMSFHTPLKKSTSEQFSLVWCCPFPKKDISYLFYHLLFSYCSIFTGPFLGTAFNWIELNALSIKIYADWFTISFDSGFHLSRLDWKYQQKTINGNQLAAESWKSNWNWIRRDFYLFMVRLLGILIS